MKDGYIAVATRLTEQVWLVRVDVSYPTCAHYVRRL